MTDIDIKNEEIIKGLVNKHWSLDSNSKARFNEYLIKSTNIDKYHLDLLSDQNSEDKRLKFAIDPSRAEQLDRGWEDFKSYFSRFCVYYDLSYTDFSKNKVTINKNEIKLRKAMINYYSVVDKYSGCGMASISNSSLFENEKDSERGKKQLRKLLERMDLKLHRVGEVSLPKNKTLELVISFNFADWFLGATAQDWDSCINLESDYSSAYWGGLPGLIADKNRGMIYISHGKKKTYMDIEVDSIMSRSWSVLSDKNRFGVVRWYPQRFLNTDDLKSITGLDFFNAGDWDFTSKSKIEPLFYDSGSSCFIYQDACHFRDDGYIRNDGGGAHFFRTVNNPKVYEDDVLSYSGGFERLVKEKKELSYYFSEGSHYSCEDCGCTVYEGDEFYLDDSVYCENCYNENRFVCEECGDEHDNDDAHSHNDLLYCESCLENYFEDCEECGKLVHTSNAIEIEEFFFCDSDCVTKFGFHDCEDCGEYVHDDDLINFNNMIYCESCVDEIAQECDDCGELVANEDMVELDNGEICCKACIQKEIDKDQIFFEFDNEEEVA